MRLSVPPSAGRLWVLTVCGSLSAFVCFKLLSSFVAPANLILCLLLVAHPLGVLAGARWYGNRPGRAATAFLAVLAATFAGFFVLRFVHPTLKPIWATTGFPVGDVALFMLPLVVLLGPFFGFIGVVEFLLLSEVRGSAGRTGLAYGLVLLGSLVGIATGYLLLPVVGASGLVAVAIGLAALVAFPHRRAGVAACTVAVAVAVASGFVPALDAAFVTATQPTDAFTGAGLTKKGGRLLAGRWDGEAYTQFVAYERDGEPWVAGVYDNLVYWDVPGRVAPGPSRAFDAFVYDLLDDGSHVAIIGVGGGRQLNGAIRAGRSFKVDGYEINRAVVDYFSAVNPDANGGVFTAPGVTIHAEEGRRGIAVSDSAFDCIYLPESGSVLGYYRTMLTTWNFIHTREAYSAYLDRLKPTGILAVLMSDYTNPGRVVTTNIDRIFRGLGLHTRTLRGGHFVMVLGTRPAGDARLARADTLARERGIPAEEPRQGPLAFPMPTDDHGALSAIFLADSIDTLKAWLAISLGGCAVAVLLAWLWFRRRLSAAAGAGGTGVPVLLGAALGASFALMQNALILQVCSRWWNMTDGVIIGSTAFLAFSVAGAWLSSAAERRVVATLACLVALAGLAVAALVADVPPWVLAAAGPMLMITCGTAFPLLLSSQAGRTMPVLFAADSAGSLLATVVVLFVPLIYGVRVFSLLAVVVAVVATGAVLATGMRVGRRVRATPASTRKPAGPDLRALQDS